MKYIKDIVQINKRCYGLKTKKGNRYKIIFAILTRIHNITLWKLGGTITYIAGEFADDIHICHGCAYVAKIQQEILKEFKQLKKRDE